MIRRFVAWELLIGSVMVVASARIAPAQVVAEHQGASDPQTEGFTLVTEGTASTGAVMGDGGFDAWQLGSTGLVRYMTGDLSASQKADALANGWEITLRGRVAGAPDQRGLVTSNLENVGGRRFDINVGLDANGDTFVRLNDNIITNPQLEGVGSTFTLTGAGDGYHLYELVYDPDLLTADLFVDGVERISDYPGHTNFVRTLGFYMGTYQNHIGNYNFAQFEIVEPIPTVSEWGLAVMALLVLTVGSLFFRRNGLAFGRFLGQKGSARCKTPANGPPIL